MQTGSGLWVRGRGWEKVGALSRMAPEESSGNRLGPGSETPRIEFLRPAHLTPSVQLCVKGLVQRQLWQPLPTPWRETLCPRSIRAATVLTGGCPICPHGSAHFWLHPETQPLSPWYPQCSEADSCARVRRQGQAGGEGRFHLPHPRGLLI